VPVVVVTDVDVTVVVLLDVLVDVLEEVDVVVTTVSTTKGMLFPFAAVIVPVVDGTAPLVQALAAVPTCAEKVLSRLDRYPAPVELLWAA
jgi:hypothetical protein